MRTSMNNEVIAQVQSLMEYLEQIVQLTLDSTITIRSILNNDEKSVIGRGNELFQPIEYFRRIYKDFLKMHDEIVIRKESFPPQVINKYFKELRGNLIGNWYNFDDLKSFIDQVLETKVISQDIIAKMSRCISELITAIEEDINEAKKVLNPTDKLQSVGSSLSTNRAGPNTRVSAGAVFEEKKDFTLKIHEVNKREAVSYFQQYISIAKHTDLNDPLFKELIENICDLSKDFYSSEINITTPAASSYSSIVGPSLMGKTQFAFFLARICPVFYVNFTNEPNMQYVYQAFKNVSGVFNSCLLYDIGLLESREIGLNSEDLLSRASAIKFATIGLLWNFVESSKNFKGFDPRETSDSNWFSFYIEKRNLKFEPMSISEYLAKLDKLFKKLKKNFKPPIVFIDEMTKKSEERIKLLRNICRIIGLRCVLASTSAKVNNLLNLNSVSAPHYNPVWVHAIRKLPKASLKAIIHLLNWSRFLVGENDFDTDSLLRNYGFIRDDNNWNHFKNLVVLMIKQSETCLQGIALIVFSALKEKLDHQSMARRKILNTRSIFVHVLTSLRNKLMNRKAAAFIKLGPYHSLIMMSKHTIVADSIQAFPNQAQTDRPIPTSEIVLATVNSHFYYFGAHNDPVSIPFDYNGVSLLVDNVVFINRSHFRIFCDDIFLCMALWMQVEVSSVTTPTIASIVCHFMHILRPSIRNMDAMKNDSCAQECMVHWALCNSTHPEIGSIHSGSTLLIRFIQNIQVNEVTLRSTTLFNQQNNHFLSFSVTLTSVRILKNFLDTIKIPYLIPDCINSEFVKTNLQGLCTFGNCSRLKNKRGFDIEFDLIHNGVPKKGLVECKYIDADLSDGILKGYFLKAKNRNCPLTMLVTYSMCDEWKTENYFESSRTQPNRQAAQKKVKLDESKKKMTKLAIYSAFFEGRRMKIIPLLKYDKPEGVFVIIQTNFKIPKI